MQSLERAKGVSHHRTTSRRRKDCFLSYRFLLEFLPFCPAIKMLSIAECTSHEYQQIKAEEPVNKPDSQNTKHTWMPSDLEESSHHEDQDNRAATRIQKHLHPDVNNTSGLPQEWDTHTSKLGSTRIPSFTSHSPTAHELSPH